MDVVERFLKYVSYDTKSDFLSDSYPSAEKEKILGAYLVEDLKSIGIEDAFIDEFGVVYGSLKASSGLENSDTLGFVAHMDTSPDVSGENVKPKKIMYSGGDIALSDTVSIKESVYPFLEKYVGQELIVTDGTTLLGADDKSGIAEIFSALEYLINNEDIKHGKISVCITPDEEVGNGTEHIDLQKFGAKYAYTVDGGRIGEIEYECFNAAAAKIAIKGINIHPGSAKNKMKNAVLLANQFVSMLPPAEAPAHTEGYEGFYHVSALHADESYAEVSMIIRDHDLEKLKKRKSFIENTVSYLNEVYGKDTFELYMKDSYYNMKEKIEPFFLLIYNAKAAKKKEGIEAQKLAIRGGTDGAALSYMGVPCPNLCTGGENYHSIHEFIPTKALSQMVNVIVNLIKK